jgi:hypothetical protein
MCPFPTHPLLENRSQNELDAALRCPFYIAKEASSLRKCAVRLALDEYLARVLSAELSFEEEHVDDGEEEDVDHHEQQVASVVLPPPHNIVKHFRRKQYCFVGKSL